LALIPDNMARMKAMSVGTTDSQQSTQPASPRLNMPRTHVVSNFLNPTIFWEYDVEQLDPAEWASFIVKQVFNRNVVSQPAAIPALFEYYGQVCVEGLLRQEEWLTQEGIQTAQRYLPHLRKGDFKATRRINRCKRQLAKVGAHNPKL
jgi:hypothetical protein